MLFSALLIGMLWAPRPIFTERLYYLNYPESVRSIGTVARFVTPTSAQKTRVFFHFVNKTHRQQPFVIHFKNNLKEFKFGYGVSESPATAGTTGAVNFLNSKPTDKEGGAKLEIMLKPGYTVSGMCDCVTLESTEVVSYLGDTTQNLSYKVKESSNVTESLDVSYSPTYQKLRIGTKRDGMIDGDYGTTFRYRFTHPLSKAVLLRIVMSPRGGRLSLPFVSKDGVKVSPMIPARGRWAVYEVSIPPGGLFAFETVLPGGYCYPLELRFVFVV